MIPMGMGEKDLRGNGTFGKVCLQQGVAQSPDTGAGIYNYQPLLIAEPQFQAGGIAAISDCIRTGAGY
jgi:hypothetical protein